MTQEQTKPQLKSLAAMWEHYRDTVIPSEAGPIQLEETRQSFYAGATVIIGAVHSVGQDNISAQKGLKHLQSLTEECLDFAIECMSNIPPTP